MKSTRPTQAQIDMLKTLFYTVHYAKPYGQGYRIDGLYRPTFEILFKRGFIDIDDHYDPDQKGYRVKVTPSGFRALEG